MAVDQQDMRADEEVALLALVSIETVATHHVLALGLAIARNGDGLDPVFLPSRIKLGAWQQRVTEDVDVGKTGQQLVEIAFEIRQVVAGQSPDKFRRDRYAQFRHAPGNGSIFIGTHVLSVAEAQCLGGQRLQCKLVVGQQAVAVQQERYLLYLPRVLLGPGSSE